jgi:hypothetical protein
MRASRLPISEKFLLNGVPEFSASTLEKFSDGTSFRVPYSEWHSGRSATLNMALRQLCQIDEMRLLK